MYRDDEEARRLHNEDATRRVAALERALTDNVRRVYQRVTHPPMRRLLLWAAATSIVAVAAALTAWFSGASIHPKSPNSILLLACLGSVLILPVSTTASLILSGLAIDRFASGRYRGLVLRRRFALPEHDLPIDQRIRRLVALLGELDLEEQRWIARYAREAKGLTS
jgi:hypothetical protein